MCTILKAAGASFRVGRQLPRAQSISRSHGKIELKNASSRHAGSIIKIENSIAPSPTTLSSFPALRGTSPSTTSVSSAAISPLRSPMKLRKTSQDAMKRNSLAQQVRSVNYHISRKCNYSCKFCFHTQKTTSVLPLEDAIRGLELLQAAGTEKVNFAGGEPFLRPDLLGRLCQKAHQLGMAVSIISNGSLVTREWMQQYGYYVDVMGISIDSFDPTTNAKIGRGGDASNRHVRRVLKVREWCDDYHIQFKANTVVCKLNWEEDMTQQMMELDPIRWKVFQVLILDGENAGNGALRDARSLTVSQDQYHAFVDRHRPHFSDTLIPEPNDVMQNSYLLLDEDLCFLDSSTGGKVPSESILEVGVEGALEQVGFDYSKFRQRGGIFEWTRDREQDTAVAN